MKLVGLFVLFLTYSMTTNAAVVGKEVEYKAAGTVMKGYIAYDEAISSKRPGILVVHEWWGHNEYARRRARMLAELGYTALAVDMYGNGKTASHPSDAGKFAKAVNSNLDVAQKRFVAAMKALKRHPTVDVERMAAIGYCFGGGIVLQMARLGVDLDAVVSFHGSLASSIVAQKGKLKAAVQVHNGSADPFVKKEQIESFKQEMQQAGVKYELFHYADAKHGFTSPEADKFGQKFNMPLAYNREADEKSWQRMQALFKKLFSS